MTARLLLVDNYESFTSNLYQYLCELGASVLVRRNDQLTPRQARDLEVDGIVISPGPGGPEDAGNSVPLLRELMGQRPILGVCLGHQCIGAALGARIVLAPQPRHGKTSAIAHDGRTLFAGLPNPFTAVRYHSLAIERGSLPACLEVSAEADDGVIMGVRHRDLPVEGVQFHPESILTDCGKQVLANFLAAVEG
ncbi:MAG: aminodeoxychorismate/anthranilate synthase component II [Chloroflexi bacterium]|nr:aminodeoxychorismate/anthranilate synthase component II [Chloroflexota bacterium]